jgi:hypothetical protein
MILTQSAVGSVIVNALRFASRLTDYENLYVPGRAIGGML